MSSSDSTTSTVAETAFIRFCQDVGHDLSPKPPFWMKNLNFFNKIFLKYLEHNKSHLPIVAFINANRKTLEKPIVSGMEPNDKWLLFSKDLPEPETKTVGNSKPRGAFLAMKDDDWTRCLPLSEVYAVCVGAAESDSTSRRGFHGVSMDTVPALFLKLFYAMLLEAEPDNVHFKDNVSTSEDLLSTVDAVPGIGETIGTMLQSDGAKQLQTMLQGVMSSFDPSSKEMLAEGMKDFTQKGDLSGLFASMGPMLQQTGLSDVLSGLMKGVMGGAAPQGSSAASSDTLMIDSKSAEEQE